MDIIVVGILLLVTFAGGVLYGIYTSNSKYAYV